MILLVYLAAAMGAAATIKAPQVQTESVGPNEHRITVILEGAADPSAAASPVAIAAEQACAGLNVIYGKYEFESLEPASNKSGTAPARLVFRQDIACAAEVETSAAEAPVQLADVELDALAPSIMGLSNQFFSAHDKSDDEVTFTLIDQKAMGQSFGDWSDKATRDRKELGTAAVRRLVRLTWYQNPPGATQPGLYAAVDFAAEYSEQEECGYLIWTRPSGSATFLITRIDVTRIPHDIDSETRAAMRAKSCPGG